MAETYKVLGQASLAATTETAVYTVPAVTSTVVSSISVCNRTATPVSVRISVSVGGVSTTDKDYIYYDIPVPGKDTFVGTLGLTLGAGDILRGYASTTGISIGIYGVERT